MSSYQIRQRELHPPGWHRVTVIGEKPSQGDAGPSIAWTLESSVARSDGQPFRLNYFTTLTDGPKAKLPPFLAIFGVDYDGGTFETDGIIGQALDVNIAEVEKNGTTYANIIGIRPARPPRSAAVPAPRPASAPVADAPGGANPFALDREYELQAQMDRIREERLREDEAA